jgi:hypothetical protein
MMHCSVAWRNETRKAARSDSAWTSPWCKSRRCSTTSHARAGPSSRSLWPLPTWWLNPEVAHPSSNTHTSTLPPPDLASSTTSILSPLTFRKRLRSLSWGITTHQEINCSLELFSGQGVREHPLEPTVCVAGSGSGPSAWRWLFKALQTKQPHPIRGRT